MNIIDSSSPGRGRSYIKVVGFVDRATVLLTSVNLFSYISTQHGKKKAEKVNLRYTFKKVPITMYGRM